MFYVQCHMEPWIWFKYMFFFVCMQLIIYICFIYCNGCRYMVSVDHPRDLHQDLNSQDIDWNFANNSFFFFFFLVNGRLKGTSNYKWNKEVEKLPFSYDIGNAFIKSGKNDTSVQGWHGYVAVVSGHEIYISVGEEFEMWPALLWWQLQQFCFPPRLSNTVEMWCLNGQAQGSGTIYQGAMWHHPGVNLALLH